MKWLVFCVLAVVVITVAVADGEIWEEDDHEVLIRSERGAKNRGMYICYHHSLFIISFIYLQMVWTAARKSPGSLA